MNKPMLAVGIIMLSMMALVVVSIIQNYTSGGELDYYLLKETAESSMVDSLDVAFYRENATLRIDKEKFVESFIRRFADSVDQTRNYDIKIYDINEAPPKVSIKIDSATTLSFDSENVDMSTSIDAILETRNKSDKFTTDSIISGELDGTLKSD